ncbi:uncharacterized protein LOC142772116 isoform X3 [Rhipicephalus microplus]|uniref:uncharacterized protein LOC142772116 isoform X3 n=1 Tax=Rhipicephalus microplus TaxID=6941 RepID=UPI003F6D0E28
MACYEDLVCPLNSVLKVMKMTEVEREAKIVVESLVSTVSANSERQHMAALLRNISADRTLFHHTRTVYDLNSQTTQQVSTDFMGGLSCEARIIYSTEVRLADEVVDLATATRDGIKHESIASHAQAAILSAPGESYPKPWRSR